MFAFFIKVHFANVHINDRVSENTQRRSLGSDKLQSA